MSDRVSEKLRCVHVSDLPIPINKMSDIRKVQISQFTVCGGRSRRFTLFRGDIAYSRFEEVDPFTNDHIRKVDADF